MADKDLEFLRALHVAGAQSPSTPLPAEQVNRMGALLALTDEDVFSLVERLRKEGLLEVQWGGKVTLTPQGERQATGQAASGTTPSYVVLQHVNVAEGGSVAVGPRATAGAGAMGAGAIRIEIPRGDLAAALDALKLTRPKLTPEAQASAEALEKELECILQETQQPEPDKSKLEGRITHTRKLLDEVDGISKTAAGLFAPEGVIGMALAYLARWIGGG